jgi:LmbE family N-acetylglucosaminyl deacetylase
LSPNTKLSRRVLLAGAASAIGLRAQPPKRLKVVVTGGHPGDPEYGCGGTIAKYADQGHEVAILYLNRGDITCGENNGRVGEAKRAGEILKARPVFADQCDGHAIVDNAHYDSFRALLAAERPDVLFTHWPVDGHRDHRAISMLTYDSWFKLGKRGALYYYEVSDGEDTLMFHPTDYVDITSTEPRKKAACYAHASQSPDRYYALQSEVSRFRGLESGHAQAEAFVRHAQSEGGALP